MVFVEEVRALLLLRFLSTMQGKSMGTAEERTRLMERIRELANSSPYYRHVQMQVTGFTGQGCIMTMIVEDQHTNLFGNTHGGAVASLADSTCGISLAVALDHDEYAMTQHLDVNYLRPSGKGILRAEGRLISRGKSSAVLEADIFNESGEKVAHAHTIHSIRRRPGGFLPEK
jgi:acyl-CoA thioesterase